MTTAKTKARQKYEEKRIKMTVSFNADKDQERINFAKSVNFSEWIKQQIDQAIEVSKQ